MASTNVRSGHVIIVVAGDTIGAGVHDRKSPRGQGTQGGPREERRI